MAVITANAYDLAAQRERITTMGIEAWWEVFWKIKILPKIKDICPFCLSSNEETPHLLIDRGVVKNWLSSSTAINNNLPGLDGDWKDWIFSNIEAKRWTKQPQTRQCSSSMFSRGKRILYDLPNHQSRLPSPSCDGQMASPSLRMDRVLVTLGEPEQGGLLEIIMEPDIPKANNIEAELWALRDGLKLLLTSIFPIQKLK
ncbi:hypothetical protein GOBAR_DD24119 [Gossypium barbadense]|nr:hypothetical protein GOBAR_DD24119 [Gossypium barbadense]